MSNKHDTDTFEATSQQQYVTRTATIHNVDGIIHARIVLPGARLPLEDAQENIHAIAGPALAIAALSLRTFVT